jgi:osmoprotectant transport system permease protein
MTERQILTKAELPLALPLLFAGIRTAANYVVATVPLGALVGTDGGLGDIIANQASYRFSGVLGAAICVAILALVVDLLLGVAQWLLTPKALRTTRLPTGAQPRGVGGPATGGSPAEAITSA